MRGLYTISPIRRVPIANDSVGTLDTVREGALGFRRARKWVGVIPLAEGDTYPDLRARLKAPGRP